MAVKFFGQFLVEAGAVTREALLAAVELQERHNLRFGEVAVAMGFATKAEIERAHLAQRHEDLQLGHILVRQGVMTEAQMDQVVTRQRNSHLFVGEALVREGALTQAELERHLVAYDADQAPYRTGTGEAPSGVPAAELWGVVAEMTCKMLTRIAGVPCRPGCWETTVVVPVHPLMVSIDLSGEVAARYHLTVPDAVREAIGRALLDEADVSHEPEEVLDDTAMEFANIVCGNVAARAAQGGRRIEIAPPLALRSEGKGIPVPAGRTGLLFPIHLSDGDRLTLSLFVGE